MIEELVSETHIPVRLGVVQRVLPSYRVPFFDNLARACTGGLGLFAGAPRAEESIENGAAPLIARRSVANNHHLLHGPLYLCWQSGLLRWLEEWQPEVLVVEANPRYLNTPRAVAWMHARQRPVIGWGLGVPATSGALDILRSAARKRFLNQFDALITYSQKGAAGYCHAGFAPERVFVAPNAMAPRPVEPPPERPPDFAGGQATVLFVGRLQARKRIDLLLRACAALPEGVRPRLWLVGDGPARAELEALAHRQYPEAQFLGARHGAELEPFFLAADLFVLPGTGGLAVQEAMSYALPVVVAEGDGTQNDLVQEGNGWRVEPGSLERLTHILTVALSDVGRLRRMGRESYRIVSEVINLEKMVEVFAAAIQSVS
jgi:glycosyltransferase involved in cell wall biosynthesis